MKHIIIFLLLTILASCASHHGDKTAIATPETPKKKVLISAEKVKLLSDKTHTMILLTFENTGEDWMKYKASSFSCGKECDLKTNVIIGEDLRTWMKSQYYKRHIARHNNALIYSGAIILGVAAAITGSASGSDGLAAAGATAYGIGVGGAVYDEFKESQFATKTGQIDPQSDHIYNPFSVPSSGFAKKWILVHTPKNQKISDITLKMENEGGEIETYNLSL